MKTIVAFLVINQIPELPTAAIQSVLDHSDANICVGYLNEEDIVGLDLSPRISFRKLSSTSNLEMSGSYRDFSENLFYQIVQLKWQLLDLLLSDEFETIIYSDLDVIWLQNPITSINTIFNLNEDTSVLIQSFTSDPSQPRLCMGFVAFKKSDFSKRLVRDCKALHSELILSDSKIGDDDVVTKYFMDSSNRSKIQSLPQSTFPVGSLLNLYTSRPRFPGLSAPKPYIFHLNYVVGLQNKRIMLRLLKRHYAPMIHTKGLPAWRLLVLVKRLRIISWKLKQILISSK